MKNTIDYIENDESQAKPSPDSTLLELHTWARNRFPLLDADYLVQKQVKEATSVVAAQVSENKFENAAAVMAAIIQEPVVDAEILNEIRASFEALILESQEESHEGAMARRFLSYIVLSYGRPLPRELFTWAQLRGSEAMAQLCQIESFRHGLAPHVVAGLSRASSLNITARFNMLAALDLIAQSPEWPSPPLSRRQIACALYDALEQEASRTGGQDEQLIIELIGRLADTSHPEAPILFAVLADHHPKEAVRKQAHLNAAKLKAKIALAGESP